MNPDRGIRYIVYRKIPGGVYRVEIVFNEEGFKVVSILDKPYIVIFRVSDQHQVNVLIGEFIEVVSSVNDARKLMNRMSNVAGIMES